MWSRPSSSLFVRGPLHPVPDSTAVSRGSMYRPTTGCVSREPHCKRPLLGGPLKRLGTRTRESRRTGTTVGNPSPMGTRQKHLSNVPTSPGSGRKGPKTVEGQRGMVPFTVVGPFTQLEGPTWKGDYRVSRRRTGLIDSSRVWLRLLPSHSGDRRGSTNGPTESVH